MPLMCFRNQVFIRPVVWGKYNVIEDNAHTEREGFSKWCHVEPLYGDLKGLVWDF